MRECGGAYRVFKVVFAEEWDFQVFYGVGAVVEADRARDPGRGVGDVVGEMVWAGGVGFESVRLGVGEGGWDATRVLPEICPWKILKPSMKASGEP